MVRPRRERKEPLDTLGDWDYPFRLRRSTSTFMSWMIRVQVFFPEVIETSLILALVCYHFARRLIREPHKSPSDIFSDCFDDVMMGHHVSRTVEKKKRTTWIMDVWSTAIMFCPYIIQVLLLPSQGSGLLGSLIKEVSSEAKFPNVPLRLLKRIKGQIFPKPRMNPSEKIAAFGSSSPGRARLIMDSGASSHFVGDASMLQNIIYFPHDQRQSVSLADGFCLPIVGIGTLLFNGLSECGTYTRSYGVPNVRYVSGLAMNVISVSQLDKEHGLCSAFHSGKCEIVKAGGIVIGEAALVDRLYEVVYLHVPRGLEL